MTATYFSDDDVLEYTYFMGSEMSPKQTPCQNEYITSARVLLNDHLKLRKIFALCLSQILQNINICKSWRI